ncbi:hypothetical protein TNCV_708501 [Trichonephila clavipes]|nr:hypothetical protein TNCV_708501 [Trichonephila clavipes]
MLRSSFQWVPLHVNFCLNEIADGLAREDSHKECVYTWCLPYFFQKLLTGSSRISVPLGDRPPYRSSMKKTVLALICWGQAVDESRFDLTSDSGGVRRSIMGSSQWHDAELNEYPSSRSADARSPCSDSKTFHSYSINYEVHITNNPGVAFIEAARAAGLSKFEDFINEMLDDAVSVINLTEE